MNATPTNTTEEEISPTGPVPDADELPVRQPDEFEDVPLPRKVTRETEALHEKEDLRHGDEGIDDPPDKQEGAESDSGTE